MTLTREQAIKDCKELWKYLAISGWPKKIHSHEITQKLFKKGKISQPKYQFACPLCELYNKPATADNPDRCEKCPWSGEGIYRCECDCNSPYRIFKYSSSPHVSNKNRKLASAVYQLVKTFK